MGEMSFALMFSAFGVVCKLQSVDSVRCCSKMSVCKVWSLALCSLLFGGERLCGGVYERRVCLRVCVSRVGYQVLSLLSYFFCVLIVR